MSETHVNNVNLQFRKELIDAYANQDDIKKMNKLIEDSMWMVKPDEKVYYMTADGLEFESEGEMEEYLNSQHYKDWEAKQRLSDEKEM